MPEDILAAVKYYVPFKPLPQRLCFGAHAEIFEKAKSLGLPIIKADSQTVITGPYSSERKAKEIVINAQKLRGIKEHSVPGSINE